MRLTRITETTSEADKIAIINNNAEEMERFAARLEKDSKSAPVNSLLQAIQNRIRRVMNLLANYVPTSRTVNGKALKSDITIAASDLSFGGTANQFIKGDGTLFGKDVDDVVRADATYLKMRSTRIDKPNSLVQAMFGMASTALNFIYGETQNYDGQYCTAANFATQMAGESAFINKFNAKQNASTARYQMGNAGGTWETMSTAQQNVLNSGATASNIGDIANKHPLNALGFINSNRTIVTDVHINTFASDISSTSANDGRLYIAWVENAAISGVPGNAIGYAVGVKRPGQTQTDMTLYVYYNGATAIQIWRTWYSGSARQVAWQKFATTADTVANANTLGGLSASSARTANTIAARDSNGYVLANHLFSQTSLSAYVPSSSETWHPAGYRTSDGLFHPLDPAWFRNRLGLGNTTGALPVANGGTNANSLNTALSSLGFVLDAGGSRQNAIIQYNTNWNGLKKSGFYSVSLDGAPSVNMAAPVSTSAWGCAIIANPVNNIGDNGLTSLQIFFQDEGSIYYRCKFNTLPWASTSIANGAAAGWRRIQTQGY